MEIGDRIKTRRTQLKMSQETLSKYVGASRVSITDWENSKSIPKSHYLIGLSKGLQVSVDWLLLGEDLPVPPQLYLADKIDMDAFREVYKLFEDSVLTAKAPHIKDVRAECLAEMYDAKLDGRSPAAAMLDFLTSQ